MRSTSEICAETDQGGPAHVIYFWEADLFRGSASDFLAGFAHSDLFHFLGFLLQMASNNNLADCCILHPYPN